MISAAGGHLINDGVNIDSLPNIVKDLGAEALIHKPINAHKLIDCIKTILI